MTEEDKNALIRQRDALIAEKIEKMRAVEAAYKPKLDAYQVLLEDSPSHGLSTPFSMPRRVPPPPPRLMPPMVKAKSLTEAVNEAISNEIKVNGEDAHFGSVVLFDYIQKHYPGFASLPSDLSNCLWRLRKDGKILFVKEGSGRMGSVYTKTKGETAN